MTSIIHQLMLFLVKLFRVLLLVGFVYQANAGTVRGALRFEQIGAEHGLEVQSITSVVQDKQGLMWFGTQRGLFVFDGYRAKNFQHIKDQPDSLSDNWILALHCDAQGDIWIGTSSGFSRYHSANGKFQQYQIRENAGDPPLNIRISDIVPDKDKGLWLASEKGLINFNFASEKFTVRRHDQNDKQSIRDDAITSLVSDFHGDLWIGTRIGLDKLDVARNDIFHVSESSFKKQRPERNFISALYAEADTLWVGSFAGLSKINISSPELIRQPVLTDTDLADEKIQSLLVDSNHQLWIGMLDNGLTRFDPKTNALTNFRNRPLDRHSLSANTIDRLFQDTNGTLWIATHSGGISSVDLASGGFKRFVQIMNDATGINDSRIRFIMDAGKNRLWLGTISSGLMLFDLNSHEFKLWKHNAKDPHSLVSNQVRSVRRDSKNQLWVGTTAGLDLFNQVKQQFIHVPLSDKPDVNNIEDIHFDRSGGMWIATRGGVLYRPTSASPFQLFTHDPANSHSLINNWTFSIIEDVDGNIWIGTFSGLERFDSDTRNFSHFLHHADKADSLSHDRVQYLYRDVKGDVWVGTSGGLNRMNRLSGNNISFRFYPTKIDGSSESIGAIAEDPRGNIWISKISGISKIDPQSGAYKNYTASDGIVEGSYLIGAGATTADGQIHFGSFNGFTSFFADDIRENHQAPKIVINNLSVVKKTLVNPGATIFSGDQPSQAPIEIKIVYPDSSFDIEFSALHFAAPSQNSYAYQLQGFDKNWINTDASKRYANYTNLDPGRYVFKVIASNKDGVWNQEGASVIITVTPPYWKTWWFRICLLCAFVFAVATLLISREKILKNQKNMLELTVKKRTEELQKQKTEVEQAHHNISVLSEIGKKITANLDQEAIIRVLYEQVNSLMDVDYFAIGFYLPQEQQMMFSCVFDDGVSLPSFCFDSRNKILLSTKCLNDEVDILINDWELEKSQDGLIPEWIFSEKNIADKTLVVGSHEIKTKLSMLYVPFFVSGTIRGVISVQSEKKSAYHDTDLDILRTLASYVGVALHNSETYQQLISTQSQLVEREKLAALGSLVAGIAHELNTPIGNSLLIASSIEDHLRGISNVVASGAIKRSEFLKITEQCVDACKVLLRTLATSSRLVSSFKQVSVDQTSDKQRSFNLELTVKEILTTMNNQIRLSGHTITVDIPSDIVMHSYPGPLGQVLINLLQNAIVHGFDGMKNGAMEILARVNDQQHVVIQFKDNGLGIPEKNIKHIFEPFFTTKLGQGGSGLGLSVTYNIVSSILNGKISVESHPGLGATFTLVLPLSANSSGGVV
ncbi:sensor histidine kinase [Undibacterium sp. SXout11W]|uniref:sensor histidine kinase n=1 Tax=Undibacterium sp. SXout11W TaxID=3413050 RepID=UPI003BF38981